MSEIDQQLLQISAKLFQKLDPTSFENVEREEFLKEIDALLDERGQLINLLNKQQVENNTSSKNKSILMGLDKGIVERLQSLLAIVKHDLKTVQVTKQNEKQYLNPYASVQVMDGKYYDQKK